MLKESEIYDITKSTCTIYKMRHPSGMYWADITLDDQATKGRISIASDFGTWQYFWGAPGPSFKQFIIDLSIHYAADKFGENRWVDVEATLNNYTNSVKESYENGHINKSEKNKLLQEIKAIHEDGCINEEQLTQQLYPRHELMSFFNYCPDFTRDISPRFKKFWDIVWPAFIAELKKEIAPAENLPPTT